MGTKGPSHARKSLKRGAVALAMISISAPAHSKPVHEVCGEVQSRAATAALGKVSSWNSLHRNYMKFAACDDGGLSEDITEVVVHMLAHHWSWLRNLAAETKADPSFETFVLNHIDSTGDTDDLIEIKRTAATLCPPELVGLCKRIRGATIVALR